MVVGAGREAYEQQDWGEAYRHLSAADELGAEDQERLAVAAHLAGHDDECIAAFERAHFSYGRDGDDLAAGRCAVWAGLVLLLGSRSVVAGGWFARAARTVAALPEECATSGFLLVPRFLEAEGAGEAGEARGIADRIVAIATRCGDADLLALGLLCQGEAAVALGEVARGMTCLDDAMVSVTTGEVSPLPAGIVYCGVIEACVDAFDMQRATQWTEALTAWCAGQTGLVPYRGQCLVHRSQVLQARGAWREAAAAAQEANRFLNDARHPAVGAALYQVGEMHRLRGEHASAERAYREAALHGREPAPGLALLRLAQGQVAAAVASIQRVVDETRGQKRHTAMLAAAVEIHLSAGDLDAGRRAATELAALVDLEPSPHLQAVVAHATGSVRHAEGDPAAALVELRRAATLWQDLGMPYEAARAGVEIARACTSLADAEAAGLELDAAMATFERLGARRDLARAGRLAGGGGSTADALTARQCDVLRVVATGRSNREVAAALGISEHTVARHLQNIYATLGLSSRAAATAYAHQHGLL